MGRPWGTVVSPRITAVFRMSKCGYPSFENKNILCSKTCGIDKMVKMGENAQRDPAIYEEQFDKRMQWIPPRRQL